jgi:voltage-gated potassium channel
MAKDRPKKEGFSNAYEMFILVLTLLSLAIMVLLVVPLSEPTKKLLTIYDNVICVIFLFDFGMRMSRAPSARHYFLREGGWLDLIGSVPSVGIFRFAGLLRLARLSRLARVIRLLRGQKKQEIIDDVLAHRGQYAGFVTIMAAAVVLVVASIVVLAFESGKEGANIVSGGDALWWAVVTMTTVGYGDRFPVSAGGRITGLFVMFGGVGIIGALASILASFLVSPTEPEAEPEPPAEPKPAEPEPAAITSERLAAARTEPTPAFDEELRAIRAEIEALRKTLDRSPQAP